MCKIKVYSSYYNFRHLYTCTSFAMHILSQNPVFIKLSVIFLSQDLQYYQGTTTQIRCEI